jgi:hypothetical protein
MTRTLIHRITISISLCCACGSSEDDDAAADVEPLSPRDRLVADYWAAMQADDYAPSTELYERAGALLEESPDDGVLHGYRAAAGIWILSEAQRDPGFDQSQLPAIAFASLEGFEKAATLAANDGHWRGFHAGTQFLIAMQLGSDTGMSDALAIYDQAYEAYPEFGPIAKVFTMVTLDGHHAIFPEVEQAVWDHFDRCFGELDHADPVLSASALESPRALCANSPLVPHLHEGMSILGGDILLRDGNVHGARRLFEGAKLSPTYDVWIGKGEIEARLGDLQERADLYADADPANDPSVGVAQHACTGCHAE